MFLIDTNIVSETRRARPHGGVLAFLRAAGDQNLHVSAVTLGELQAGVEITRDQNNVRAAEIEAWVDDIARTWNVLPINAEVFRLWAKLMHRQPATLTLDAMIAATALVHGLKVVTRNVRDFKGFAIEIINPF